MSIEAMSLALHHSAAKGTDKLVLIGIANHSGDGGAWPSLETLARYAGVSDRQVRRSIVALKELGEIDYETNGAPTRSQYKPNIYHFTLGCPESCDRSMNHKIRADTGDNQGGHVRHSGRTRMSTKPYKNQQENLKPYAQQVERPSWDSQFNEFWNAYPLKVGKQAARRAYAKAIKEAEAATILAGATRYAGDPNRVLAYTAHAATWLNAGRWDDELLPEREKSTEERQAEAKAINDKRRDADRERTKELQAESRAAEERVRLNPPKRCEHDRVAVICTACARNNVRSTE